MKMIRAFIAIPLPTEVKVSLSKTISDLSAGIPDRAVRWVKPELMHLTIRFLGDTEEIKLENLSRALDKATAKQEPFRLKLDALGSFPNFKRPRVLWVGLKGELAKANVLKENVDGALEEFGWPQEDRPFHPHLTTGRVKDSSKISGVRWQAAIEALSVPVQFIYLVQSDLTPQGPIYTIRNKSNLHQPTE
jgi:2'-5' RNA ligase